MIDGVVLEKLVVEADERGRLVPLFRADDEGLGGFGQVHVSTLYPGVVKAWHRHRETTDTITCVSGMVRVGLCDERRGSKTENELNEYYLGEHNPQRLRIPAGVWFGLKGVGTREAIVVVHADRPYDAKDPDEERMHPLLNEIPFDWERRDG